MSRAATVLLLCALLGPAGCTDDGGGAAATAPPERSGPVTLVDTCRLLEQRDLHDAFDRPLRVVGRRVDAPALPTETCLWGSEFSVAGLELRFTPGPVAADTFEKAYGPAAGGDTVSVDDLGDSAYARSTLAARTLDVLVGGSVLHLEASAGPGRRVGAEQLGTLARRAVERLPENPRLPGGRVGAPCSRVPERVLTRVLGGGPQLRREARGDDGAVMCSWGGLPGRVLVTVRTDPTQVTNNRANLTPRIYDPVRRLGVEAYSQKDRAGDLLMFVGDVLIEIDALPGVGYESTQVTTTGPERRLARAVVRAVVRGVR